MGNQNEHAIVLLLVREVYFPINQDDLRFRARAGYGVWGLMKKPTEPRPTQIEKQKLVEWLLCHLEAVLCPVLIASNGTISEHPTSDNTATIEVQCLTQGKPAFETFRKRLYADLVGFSLAQTEGAQESWDQIKGELTTFNHELKSQDIYKALTGPVSRGLSFFIGKESVLAYRYITYKNRIANTLMGAGKVTVGLTDGIKSLGLSWLPTPDLGSGRMVLEEDKSRTPKPMDSELTPLVQNSHFGV
jgi:hypothetical protein